MYIKIIINLVIFCFLIVPSLAAQTDTQQLDRRIEEEKRKDLRPTEADYYDASKLKVEQEEILTADYLDALVKKEIVTEADGAFVMSVLLGKDENLLDFFARKQFLLDNKILSRKFENEFREEEPLRRGLLAYMVYQALGIKGGLTLRVFGPSQRYAQLELVYRGIMFSGSSSEYLSGEELIYVSVKAAEYRAKNKGK